MRRSVALFVALAACSRSAEQQSAWHAPRTSAPIALFSNGGFEAGNLSSWTVTTNLNPGITYPPASVTDLNLQAGGTARSYARNGATPQVPFGLSAAATLRYPRYGTWSAVINEGGTGRNVNLLTQSMATTAADVDPADGQIHVRFVVAPVLQNPAHTTTQQPYYYVLVTNVTQNITLFSRFNYANDTSAPWQADPGTGGGAVTYTNWQVVDVPGTAGSIAIGDTVQAQVIGAGCSLGGHWGEAYVDSFGAFLPGLSVVAHAPQQANAGSNLTTRYAVNNSGSTSATNVIVDAPTPPQTTFVSLTAPAGAVCTTPAVGAAGTVTCNFASMNPLSGLSFTLVTAIAAGASGTISNNSYTVRSDSDAALLGPLAATTVTSGVSYADLSVTMTDGTAGVAWSQALTYTIVVSNAGPVTATNATVVDTIPAQLTGAAWTCSATGGGSCGAASGSGNINTTATLPSGASATYLLNANVVAGSGTSRVTNVVNVANGPGTTDPDTTNNRAAVTNDIGTVVTVTVQKDSTGGGLGAVVSSPAAINCGSACTSASANFVTGNLLSLSATAVPGDSFSSWSGGCSGTTNPCNISPASNTTVTAKFVPQSFTITASAPAGNGNISCTSPVLHNQSSACTISPSAGYKLSQLTDNGTDVTALVVSNSYTISAVAANHTVVASFLKDYGTVCGAGSECAAGNCVDGVCCTSACGGQCQACDVTGSVGTCTNATGAPHGSRAACTTDGSACGGSCDGTMANACAYPSGSTVCRAGTCSAGTAVSTATCNGTGTCPASVVTACTPYVCGPTACKTSCTVDTDCISGDYCSAGACVAKKANGATCSASNQCTNANCVDGVCCNSACGSQCQACDVAGSVGTCTAVSGAPHGARAACATDGSSCGGSCNGVLTTACAYPTSSCRSASCTSGTATAAASCNGAGACPAPSTTACTPYVCGPTACKTSCTADTDCISADYCSAGACVAKKANGAACSASNQCTNANCVDGVCCSSACGGQCQACDVAGSVGTCTAVSGAPHGARAACATDGSACGGSCDGVTTASCAYPTSSCRSASCTSGTATAAANCNGAGACPAPSTTACTPYICGATACKTSCTVDTDCISGDYCNAGACVAKKANGATCSANNQCTNGNCVDGVCCNSACGSQCQACDVAGSVGTCTAVSGAPHGARAACATDGSSCGGSCNGVLTTTCAYPTSSCRSASCTSGTATAAASCDGAGACPAPSTTACTPYVCGPTACKTSCTADTDCISADYCSAGACVAKKANGATCSASNQCTNGNCVDGVCCSSACGGQCQACDVAGSVGTCTAVSGAPHGARAACATDGSACGGSCDGVTTATCAYPTSSCRSASCSSGTATAAANCNGAGACPAPSTTACTPYICGATACKTSCTVDTDCISGDYCSAGACVAKKANGATCSANNQCTNANCVDGVCCNSACGSQCQACDVAGSVGTCTAVSGAPHGARAACATDGSSCGGSCNGVLTTACAYPTSSCRSASCSAGLATLAASCDGAGNCPALQTQACAPYACGPTACLGNCAADSDCAPADFCSAGVCVAKFGNGVACAGANQCASGSCADGICCDQACGGQCQACNVSGNAGHCIAVTGAPQGARPACTTDGSLCGGACNGSQGLACAYPDSTSSCRSASCSSGTAILAAGCDGAGHCPAQQTQTCNPYVCGPTACRGNCTVDTDCAAGNFCSAGVCTSLLAAGASCAGSNQCASGHCTDGVCCNQACGGQCQACDVPGSVGTCASVAGAPHGARPLCTTDGSACGGACDGTNGSACAYPTSQCRAPSCSNGVATLAAACDAAGHCPGVQTQGCSPYVCGATACLGGCASNSDCASGDWCSAGVCVPLLANGASCGAAGQCASGNCVDGLCCNSACAGQCEACNVAGSAGTCTAVVGDPRAGRPACGSDGTNCAGACDGSRRDACAYPGVSIECRTAACSAGVSTAQAFCNGAGSCPARQQSSCNAYVCGANACLTSCTADSDCANGGICISGACKSQSDPGVWVVAGAGCSSTGAAGWPLLLLLAAFALRRRRKAAIAALLLCASAARAQDSATIAVDRFQPGAGAFDVLGVWSADTALDREWHASVYGSYARDPLRLVQVGHSTQIAVLRDQSLLHLGGSVGIGDRFEVGAVLPLALQSSSGTPLAQGPLAAPAPSGGIGDLRIMPKVRLLSIGGLVLGAAAPFSLPTGRQEAYLGAGSLTFSPTALAEVQDLLPLRLLANAGMAVRGSRSLGNLRVGTAITYGLAAEMPLREKLALVASVAGEVNLTGSGSVERPMEMLAALRWSASRGIDVTAGGGPGIGNGYGTPKYRMFVAVSITPSMLPARRPLPILPLPEQPLLFPAIAVASDPPALYEEWSTPEPVLAKLEDDKVDLLAPVLFAHNGDVILPRSRAVLDAAIAILKNHTELSRLRIEGHTDDRGKPAYNLDLSKRRAKAVRSYLVKHGIAAARLESQGYGNTRPVDTNATDGGRAHNRRVELMILQRLQTRTAALSPP